LFFWRKHSKQRTMNEPGNENAEKRETYKKERRSRRHGGKQKEKRRKKRQCSSRLLSCGQAVVIWSPSEDFKKETITVFCLPCKLLHTHASEETDFSGKCVKLNGKKGKKRKP